MRQAEGSQQTVESDFNASERLRDDTVFWLAEVLDGSMRTPVEYTFDGHELYGRDGGALKPIFTDALIDAERLAIQRPNLSFELRRRSIEYDEYREMLVMASGSAPNTMVVVSDFPPELMDISEDIGGYNARRKQTMLRVITRDPDGHMLMRSQSLDGSNRQALEEIYYSLGYKPENGELLGQRMQLNLEAEDQQYLVDKLSGVYDRSLTASNGGSWYMGREGDDRSNTYDFVLKQADLVEAYIDRYSVVPEYSGHLLYSLAAAMQARFEQRDQFRYIDIPESSYSQSAFIEMEMARREAQAVGKVFSGCGASLSAEGETSTSSDLSASGYGNKSSNESSYKFDKYMACVVCIQPPKGDKSKKMCGPCGICKPCDRSLQTTAKAA